MYANVLFSLPENTRLELRRVNPGFFDYSSDSLKRTISVLHSPGGPGTERVASNLIGFHLGEALQLKRSVLGARFITGGVEDSDRMSTCSFYVDVEADVKKSTEKYKAYSLRSNNLKPRYESNLCREIPMSSFVNLGAMEGPINPVESQRHRDILSNLANETRPRNLRIPDTVGLLMGLDVRMPILTRDEQTLYQETVTQSVRSLYYTRGGNRNEPSTRQSTAERLTHDFQTSAAQAWIASQAPTLEQAEGGLRATREDNYQQVLYRSLVQGIGTDVGTLLQGMTADFDGDAAYATATIAREDRRPHLPQNQRNRGPAPRGQRW